MSAVTIWLRSQLTAICPLGSSLFFDLLIQTQTRPKPTQPWRYHLANEVTVSLSARRNKEGQVKRAVGCPWYPPI